MELGLKDRVAVVTGASKGIGYAIAREFLLAGAKVAVCARGAAELESAAAELSALGVKFCLGPHYIDKLDFDVVFRTPGLHPDKLKGALGPDTVVTSAGS